MIGKIGKALEVVDELKQMPVEERQWVLNECKQIAVQRRQQYTAMFEGADPQQQLQLLTRLRTIDIALRLLDRIEIRAT